MQKIKAKLFTVFLLSFIVASAFVSSEVYATEEDAILAEFAKDPYNLLPTQYFVAQATVDIEIDNDLLQSKIFDVTASVKVPTLDLTEEDIEKLAFAPQDEAENDKENWGIPALLGDKDYLIQNTTDGVHTSYAIADNYDARTYPYFVIANMMSKDSTNAITVTLSLATTQTETNSSLWANTTLVSSEVYPIASTTWFNLLEVANSSYPYVVHTVLANVDMTGHYIFDFDNDKYVSDGRYETFYIDVDETVLASPRSVADAIEEGLIPEYKAINPTGDDMLIVKGTTVEDLSISNMLAVPAKIDARYDLAVRYEGWTDPDDLEDDLKLAWKQQLIAQGVMDANDKISDYEITKCYWEMDINQGVAQLMKRALQDQLSISTDYRTLINSVLGDILPLATITDMDEDILTEINLMVDDNPIGTEINADFWKNVGSFFKNIGSGIASVAKKIIDVPLKAIDACKDVGGKVVTTVGGTANAVVGTAGNVVNTVTGHVADTVGGAVGAVKDVGGNLLSTLKLPLIILAGVAGLGIVIFLIIKFGRKI